MTCSDVDKMNIVVRIAQLNKVAPYNEWIEYTIDDRDGRSCFGDIFDGTLIDDAGMQRSHKRLDVVFCDTHARVHESQFLPEIKKAYKQ